MIFPSDRHSSTLLIAAIETYDLKKPGLIKDCQGTEVYYPLRLHVCYRDFLYELIFLTE